MTTASDTEPQLGTFGPCFVRFVRVIGGAQSRYNNGQPTPMKRLLSVNADAVSGYEEAQEKGCTKVFLVGRDEPFIVDHPFEEVARMLEVM